jgi:peptidoglycan/xylan/chitin deacetylase (PgdA/CDA1 family)
MSPTRTPAPAAAVAAVRRAAVPWLRRRLAIVGSVVEVRTSVPDVVLTYDDGPRPGITEPILSALADAGATATFFVLLSQVRRAPALLAEVSAAGHEIGLHGLDHRPLPDLPAAEVERRTREGRAELEDLVGRRIRWFRPPYGRQTPATWRAVRRAGVMPVLWGPTTWDWRDVSPAERIEAAVRDIRPGAILLAHDGWAGPEDGVDDGPAPVLDRAALTRDVLARYRSLGLGGCSLGEAAAGGRLVRAAVFRR